MKYPELTTERLVLRLPAASEAHIVGEYVRANRAFLEPWSPRRVEEYYSDAHWARRLPEVREDFTVRSVGLVFYLFEEGRPDRIVGRIGYSSITRGVAHFCFLGYELAEVSCAKGYMTEALIASNSYMFEVLNLHRIMANYMPRNAPSAGVLERLGFAIEGQAHEYLCINGRWEDHTMTALTNKNWKEVV